MSSRTSVRFAFPLVAATLVAGVAGFAISACSSSTPADTTSSEGGVDASAADSSRIKVEAGPEVDSGAPAQTSQQCIDACNAAHPASVAKETAIDTCWMANCQGPCIDNPPGGYDAGPEGGADAGADASDVCGSGVGTSEPTCNDCTQQYCCTSWNGCFKDTDCSALDDCLGQCP